MDRKGAIKFLSHNKKVVKLISHEKFGTELEEAYSIALKALKFDGIITTAAILLSEFIICAVLLTILFVVY